MHSAWFFNFAKWGQVGKGQVGKHAIPLKWYFKPEIKTTRIFLAISYSAIFFDFTHLSIDICPLVQFCIFLSVFVWGSATEMKKSFGSGSSRKRNKSVFKHQRDEWIHLELNLELHLDSFRLIKWTNRIGKSNRCTFLVKPKVSIVSPQRIFYIFSPHENEKWDNKYFWSTTLRCVCINRFWKFYTMTHGPWGW